MVLLWFGFDDQAIMFWAQLFDMSGLGAADDKLSTVSIDSLADIAEANVVVSFRILSDQVKADGNCAPSVDFGKWEGLVNRLLRMIELVLYDAFLFFH